ncbi:MAG: M23 family metallopeptidase [Vicinamibacterales bacterium]
MSGIWVARTPARTLVAVVVVCGVLAGCGKGGGGGGSVPTAPTGPTSTGGPSTPTTASDGTILLQNLPLDLSALDYAAIAALRAGRDADWLPVDDYGRVLPASSARPMAQTNPQAVFHAVLGTPVLAVVSGTVTSIPTLYSNDFSVMIASSGQGGTWEHEHVMNVRVRVGDRVTAGQQIADVSDFECAWGRSGNPADPICQSRLGLVELGLLYGGTTPMHRCPFEPEVVDPSKQADIFAQLTSARTRIKAAFGSPSLFGESSWATPQCVTLSRVSG